MPLYRRYQSYAANFQQYGKIAWRNACVSIVAMRMAQAGLDPFNFSMIMQIKIVKIRYVQAPTIISMKFSYLPTSFRRLNSASIVLTPARCAWANAVIPRLSFRLIFGLLFISSSAVKECRVSKINKLLSPLTVSSYFLSSTEEA